MISPQAISAARVALGQQLAASREAAGLVQKQLADLLKYGRSSIANVETGRQNVPRSFWVECDKHLHTGTALADAHDQLDAMTRQWRRETAEAVERVRAKQARQLLVAVPTDLPGWRQGQWPTAEPVLMHGSVSVATADAGDERARELFIRGSSLLHSNDRQEFEEAQALLDRAVGRDPRFSRAIAARGYTRWRQYFAGWANSDTALTGAFRDVDAALGIDPDSVSAHMTFIRACWDKGWHERALAAGRAIYTRNPESFEAANAFARALMNAGIAQCALPLAASVLEEDPANPSSRKLTIWCLLMLGDHQCAADAASQYLPAHPADANTRWAAAIANQRLSGGGPKAIQIARDGLTAEPGDVTLWVLLGYLYRLNGDEDSAVQAWSDGLAHVEQQLGDGPNHRLASWVANLHAAVGNRAAATSSIHALLNTDPDNGYLRYRLSHVLAELGDVDAAVQMFGEAVNCGFLSYQLARQEETLAFSRIAGAPGYALAISHLASNVERARTAYAPSLPTAAEGSHTQSYGDGK